jgi:hypothetical protein
MNGNVTLRGLFEEEPDPPGIFLCCPGAYEQGTTIELFADVTSEVEITQRIWYRVIPKPDGSVEFETLATDTNVLTLTDLPLGDHSFSFWVMDSWSHVERADITITVVPRGTVSPSMRKGGE